MNLQLLFILIKFDLFMNFIKYYISKNFQEKFLTDNNISLKIENWFCFYLLLLLYNDIFIITIFMLQKLNRKEFSKMTRDSNH